MSDGTSSQIFSTLFNQLAEDCRMIGLDPAIRNYTQELALSMWPETFHYDFSHCDLECDASLIILDLARRKRGGIQYRTRGLDGWEKA